MDTTSYWTDSTALPRFAKLKKDRQVDVVVIGAGITGATAAYLSKKTGHTVALLDRARVGGFDTRNTTAHLTCVTDTPLRELVRVFGKERAQATWEAGRAAIDQIVSNIRSEGIDCEFDWVSGYYHARLEGDADRRALQKDASLANELGFEAEFLESVPLMERPGVRFLHQAKFHPCKYVAALLRAIPGQGSDVFENSEAGEIETKPLAVNVREHKIRCRYVVLATHTPLIGRTNVVSAALLRTKLFHYTLSLWAR